MTRSELDEVLHTNRLLCEWSRSLRLWSVSTRRDTVALGPAVATDPAEVALGDVSVVDLFVILVEHHRFEVREAVRLLTLGMVRSGYPADNESVSASDAMEILERILERP